MRRDSIGFDLFRKHMIGQFFAHLPVAPVTISTTKVEPTTWTPVIDAIGTASAIQGVDVATQTAGVVKSIEFKANQHVDKGQLLVQIDDSVERADLDAAEVALERDQSQLARAKQLRATGVNSQATLQDAESALASSQSALAKIQAVLDQKSIKAPFAGILGIPQIDVGQYLQIGTVIGTLQQLDTMRVDFTVPEQQMDQMKLGQKVTFALSEDAFPYSGRIIGIDPKVDPSMRLVSVRAELQNPDDALKPGQFLRVRVELPPVANIVALPQTAVITSLYGDYVYVVESATDPAPAQQSAGQSGSSDSTLRQTLPAGSAASAGGDNLVAKQVFVKAGRRQGDLVEIASGLSPGQTVVTSGQNKLANNKPVKIDNDVNPATTALGPGDGKS